MTERRSQGSGKPSARESAMTPSSMLTAGAIVKMADETATRRSILGSMPSLRARRQASTIKRMLMAQTKAMTMAVMPYISAPLGSNINNTSVYGVRQVYHKALPVTT